MAELAAPGASGGPREGGLCVGRGARHLHCEPRPLLLLCRAFEARSGAAAAAPARRLGEPAGGGTLQAGRWADPRSLRRGGEAPLPRRHCSPLLRSHSWRCCFLKCPALRALPRPQGDDVEILVITKDGIRTDSLQLKRD